MSGNMSSDYGVYKPPKSPTTGRANPPKSPSLARAAPPAPPKSPRQSSASEEAPKSPRSPRAGRAAPPAQSGPVFSSESSSSRYEPLVGAELSDGGSGCAACGAPHRPSARFCDACGKDLRAGAPRAALFDTNDWVFNPGRYGLFGWVETVLGVIALAMGFGSLFSFQDPGVMLTPLRIAEAVMVGFGLLILLLLLIQRFFYKELFAFIYGALALGGALCAMIVVISHDRSPGSFFIVYFFAWMAANIVKLFWLCCADFGPTAPFKLEEHPLLDSKIKLFIVTGFMVLINMIGFIVQLYILTSTFEEV